MRLIYLTMSIQYSISLFRKKEKHTSIRQVPLHFSIQLVEYHSHVWIYIRPGRYAIL